MLDERGRELEAQVAADPKNLALVHQLGLLLVREGDFLAAQRVVARAIAAGARGREVIPSLLAANVPMRVVPHRAAHALAGIVGRSALQFVDLPAQAAARVVLSEGIVAGLVPAPAGEQWGAPVPGTGRLVDVRSIPGGLQPIPGSPFRLPGEMVGRCVLVQGNALYAAGEDASERTRLVAVRDLQDPHSGWRRVELPENTCVLGRPVEALLPGSRSRLLAVLLPWCLELDVRSPFSPRVLDTRPLRSRGSDERVVAASLDGRWMALLTAVAGDRFIALHDAESLEERGLVTEPGKADAEAWQDVLVAGDKLVVAAGSRGVLTLPLGLLPDPSLTAAALSPVADLKLEPGEGVVRVTRLDPARCIASVAVNGRPQRHVIVRFGS